MQGSDWVDRSLSSREPHRQIVEAVLKDWRSISEIFASSFPGNRQCNGFVKCHNRYWDWLMVDFAAMLWDRWRKTPFKCSCLESFNFQMHRSVLKWKEETAFFVREWKMISGFESSAIGNCICLKPLPANSNEILILKDVKKKLRLCVGSRIDAQGDH